MITDHIGDIFATDPNSTSIAHQANCMHIMGGGIAALIAKRYPEAVAADQKTPKGDVSKMGTYSFAKGKDGRFIFNIYSQFDIGGERPTNYESVFAGLSALEAKFSKFKDRRLDVVVAIPYGYGSVRGGGSWRIIRKMIDVIFEDSNFDVQIYQLPTQEELK